MGDDFDSFCDQAQIILSGPPLDRQSHVLSWRERERSHSLASLACNLSDSLRSELIRIVTKGALC